MSSGKICRVLAGLFAVAMFAVFATSANAQKDENKDKPPLYSYVANWAIPRAQWGAIEKSYADDEKILQQDLADGTIVGYGNDINLVHQPDAETHDDWWSANSMAGLLKVLDQFAKSGSTTSAVLETATKHWDNIYVSHHYNWRSGSFKNAYTRTAAYKLKADAPNDAVETISKNIVAPVLEKLLADGTLCEYEVDEQAIHTSAPDTFVIVYITPNADGLDKANAAIRDSVKSNPLINGTFDSFTDYTGHRDELFHTNAIYK